MAVKVNWKIISTKDLKKVNKPKKEIKSKSLVWSDVYWIEDVSFDLWVWKVLYVQWPTLTINCYNRNIYKNPKEERQEVKRDINSVRFEKWWK